MAVPLAILLMMPHSPLPDIFRLSPPHYLPPIYVAQAKNSPNGGLLLSRVPGGKWVLGIMETLLFSVRPKGCGAVSAWQIDHMDFRHTTRHITVKPKSTS